MSSSVGSESVADRIFRALRDDVLSGRYEPGEKLPTQRRLAADLGVNLASVREAVKRLEQLRLVEVRHGDAMRVTNWRAEGGLDVIAHVLLGSGGLDRATLAAIMEARRWMLCEAGRLAAARRSDEQAASLRALAVRIAGENDPGAAQALDFAFFSELVEACGNLVFVLVTNSIRQLYFEHAQLFSAMTASPEALAGLYGRAAKAIELGRREEAAAAIEELARVQEKRLDAALG